MENLPPTEPVVPQPDQQMPQPPSVITQNQQASVTIEQQPSVPKSTQEVPTTKSGNKIPVLP